MIYGNIIFISICISKIKYLKMNYVVMRNQIEVDIYRNNKI